MFARLLLLLTVVFGLTAGPAWTGEVRISAVEMECGCCPEEVESCCVSAPSESTRPEPIRGVASSQDLKLASVPVLVCLGPEEEPPPAVQYARNVAELRQFQSLPLIDRICVRLI